MPTVPTPDLLTPDAAYCEKLRAEGIEGPIIVVQLLRFKPDGGEARFQPYGALSHKLMEKARGEILYLGNTGPMIAGSDEWDIVALIRFPDIERFLGMLTDPSFQNEGRRIRESALERVQWMITYPV